jgi:hypothetical protein
MPDERWLLLLHQIPPKPAYFRAQVLRRIAQLGALPVKNSAYLLPDNEDTVEDFEWLCQEITRQGGSAWLFRAEGLVGMSSDQIEEAFRELRRPELEELTQLAEALLRGMPAIEEARAAQAKLLHRYEQIRRIDFFHSPARRRLEQLLAEVEAALHPTAEACSGGVEPGRVWVTRAGVKVDRIGSAWLIRRFLDPQAIFRFVNQKDYVHAAPEIRFDMLGGEFTHVGDQCTFEVLVSVHNLRQQHPGLQALAEIVHDIDLKDERYQRPETAGLARMLEGLCARTPDDDLRIERGGMIFDNLYQSFVDPDQALVFSTPRS